MFINRRGANKRNVTPSSSSQNNDEPKKLIPQLFEQLPLSNRGRTRLLRLFLMFAVAVLIGLFNMNRALFRPKKLLRRTTNSKKIASPFTHTSLFGEVEDFTIGKSCAYSKRRWQCKDCGMDGDKTTTCKKLPRRNKCPPFAMQGWDAPKPRSSSSYNSKFTRGSSNIITRYGLGKPSSDEYDLAQCSLHAMNGGTKASSLCFDLDRCTITKSPKHLDNNSIRTESNHTMQLPMKIFTHGDNSKRLLEKALKKYKDLPSLIEIIEDANSACLLFADMSDAVAATKSPHWNLGKNHFIIRENTGDHAFGSTQHAMAALGSNTFTEANFRSGYDVAVPMWPKWKVSKNLLPIANDFRRKRPYLLSFKGSIQNSLQPYYQHRWLAAEYLWNEPDIKIDVQCKKMNIFSGGKRIIREYDEEPTPESYNDFMLNSTFGFCPGGSGISSYRFGEVLSAGGIPVVVAGTIPVLSPEIDWSKCIVIVSEARIVDLPRTLRAISREEIEDRRQNCKMLYSSLYSSNDSTMAFIMRLWVRRIENAIQERNKFNDLNKLIGKER